MHMAIGGQLTWWLCLIVAAAAAVSAARAAPQINLINKGCSQYNATDAADFSNNLNATFSDLRGQLSGGGGRRFATAQREGSSDPVYGMVQCRSYMSEPDCLACYDFAVAQIRNCSTNGARLVYDGCFLRFESYNFYDQTIESTRLCGERSAAQPNAFSAAAQKLLGDLQLATPRINGYSAASKRAVSNDGLTIYGAAQCAETVSQGGCQGCLIGAYESIDKCFPAAEGRLAVAACFMRYSDTPFFDDNHTTDLTPFLSASGGGGGGSSVNEKAVIGGAIGGAGLVAIVVIILIWYKFSRRLRNALTGNILGATELQRPNRYSYKDLKEATNNFSEENKLGQGAFGAVYKAKLRNKTVVAVKKLEISNSRAKADFESEVRLVSNVHHRNLVRLLGCCSKGSELLLVYEYMENKSLDRFLYGENRGMLTWKQRTDIIFGTARGIAYLHENYHVTIIHRDIKPGNILLDNEFQAKIADFGLARLMPESQTHLSTNFAGTLGYTAPEYAIHGHLSEKSDIYSFGIVILEIISGRKCSDVNSDSTAEYLLREAWKLYERGMHENLADEALDSNEYEVEELKKLVEMALMCVQSPPSSRPTMSQLILMISSDGSIEQRALIRRPSFGNGFLAENVSVSSTEKSASNATASISQFTGR